MMVGLALSRKEQNDSAINYTSMSKNNNIMSHITSEIAKCVELIVLQTIERECQTVCLSQRVKSILRQTYL